jgi:hypothetical protein
VKLALRLFVLVLLAYVISSGSLPSPLRVLLGGLALGVGATTLFQGVAAHRRLLLSTLVLGLGASALAFYDAVANHHWVLTYSSLLFTLASSGDEPRDAETTRLGAARLLAALMGVAVLQKLAAPEYLDGSFFAHLIDTGALGGPAFTACPACEARAELNIDAIINFVSTPPAAGAALALDPVLGSDSSAVWRAGQFLAGWVLVFEIWLACVYLSAPAHRAAAISLVIFALGLVLMRAEWVFGSLVCALAVAASGEEPSRERHALTGACFLFVGLRAVSML